MEKATRILATILAVVLMVPSVSWADALTPEEDVRYRIQQNTGHIVPKTIQCEFTKGVQGDYSGDEPKLTPTTTTHRFGFKNIKISEGRATIVVPNGSRTVNVYATPDALTFTEKTLLGNFLVTVVALDKKSPSLKAVHSRHARHLSQDYLMPLQIYGRCKVER